MASWVSQDKLPASFQNEVQHFFPDVLIRSNIQTVEDCNKWITEFSDLTNTKWNVLANSKPFYRYEFSKCLVCHRSSRHKLNLIKNRLRRNTGCEVKLRIYGKIDTIDTRKKDPFIKRGLFGVIKITGQHNHSLSTAEAGKFLPPTPLVEGVYIDRFKDGMGVGDGRKYHQTVLQLDEKMSEEDMNNRRNNPPKRTVNHWYERKAKCPNVFQRTSKELIEKLEAKSTSMEEKGTTIRFSEDPFAVVVVTHMMKKAHELKSSSEAVFVDSTTSGDPEKHQATFMFCRCAAGAIPLAFMITKGETVEAFRKGFELLKTAVENPFHGKGGPSVFIVDELEPETKALSLVWPKSETHRCVCRCLQTMWQYLWNSKHNEIPKEHRVALMSSMQDVVYARSPAEAEVAFDNATTLASARVAGYHKWLKYIQELWEKKEEWCLAYRTEQVRKHSENEFLDLSMKIYKHLVFSLLKAHNVTTLVDFIATHLEKHYRSKLKGFADVACPLLFLLSLKFKDPSAPQDSAEEVDENSFLVKTKFETFVVYTRSSCCSCRIRLHRRYCDHQFLVLANFPRVSGNLPGLKPEDKDEILALAEEYAPPVVKVEEPCEPDNVVIQDVVSLAPPTIQPPTQPPQQSTSTAIRPAVPQRVGYYLVSLPPRTVLQLRPDIEEEQRKSLLTNIKKKLTEMDNKYKAPLADLESMMKTLNAVDSPESWSSFLRGSKSNGVSGLLFNGTGNWQQLQVQRAPHPLVIPPGATLRRIQPTSLPTAAPVAKTVAVLPARATTATASAVLPTAAPAAKRVKTEK